MTLPLDDNAVFLWTIIVLGIALPLGLSGYAAFRARIARARLERLRED
ncbi:MAG: hypothetical protein AAF296_10515 [Pseudomonadota bacterium]